MGINAGCANAPLAAKHRARKISSRRINCTTNDKMKALPFCVVRDTLALLASHFNSRCE
jgi:hypothetical protein